MEWDPSGWGPWMWSLHALGALYVLGYIVYAVRFQVLGRRAGKDEAARARFEAALTGFPAAFYAKMLGKAPRRSDSK